MPERKVGLDLLNLKAGSSSIGAASAALEASRPATPSQRTPSRLSIGRIPRRSLSRACLRDEADTSSSTVRPTTPSRPHSSLGERRNPVTPGRPLPPLRRDDGDPQKAAAQTATPARPRSSLGVSRLSYTPNRAAEPSRADGRPRKSLVEVQRHNIVRPLRTRQSLGGSAGTSVSQADQENMPPPPSPAKVQQLEQKRAEQLASGHTAQQVSAVVSIAAPDLERMKQTEAELRRALARATADQAKLAGSEDALRMARADCQVWRTSTSGWREMAHAQGVALAALALAKQTRMEPPSMIANALVDESQR